MNYKLFLSLLTCTSISQLNSVPTAESRAAIIASLGNNPSITKKIEPNAVTYTAVLIGNRPYNNPRSLPESICAARVTGGLAEVTARMDQTAETRIENGVLVGILCLKMVPFVSITPVSPDHFDVFKELYETQQARDAEIRARLGR